MKKLIFLYILLFVSPTAFAQRVQVNVDMQGAYSSYQYRVGDIVKIGNELGIIFAVSTDGRHGKAMSVSETSCNWYNAVNWCSAKGSSWHMPSIDDFRVIFKNKSILDAKLGAGGYKQLKTNVFWTSDEGRNEYYAWCISMHDGSVGGTSGTPDIKSMPYPSVRAISTF